MATPRLQPIDRLPALPPRPPDSNKGTFGKVLVVAGSRGMSGAAVLCGSAALRGGAGLVRVAVPAEILPIVAAGNPCYTTVPLPADQQGWLAPAAADELLQLVQANDVTAAGPGLGRGDGVTAAVQVLLGTQTPLVLDADGLNALQGNLAGLRRPAPTILTPHPGEFARLLGRDVATVQAQRQELAGRFAADYGLVLVLKGHGTVVTDGRRVHVSATGNPGLATGGTGDVLTGLIAALVAQGMTAFEAAQLGVYWHGLAGDLARDELTDVCLIASDLLNWLPRALRSIRST
jgi:NAD(P)H-hydrate epimerase